MKIIGSYLGLEENLISVTNLIRKFKMNVYFKWVGLVLSDLLEPVACICKNLDCGHEGHEG